MATPPPPCSQGLAWSPSPSNAGADARMRPSFGSRFRLPPDQVGGSADRSALAGLSPQAGRGELNSDSFPDAAQHEMVRR